MTLREAGSDVLNVDSSGNILLSQASNIETSSGALTVRGYNGLTLTTSSATTGEIRVLSRGTLQLDTSTNNDNILVRAGSGNINLSSTGTITLTGNTSLNNGTLRLNGLTYTFPGADSANGVLLSNGSGGLSWTTIGASSITADSLDFSEFKDELTLDADTSINGDYSLIVRAGLGSIQNSTSGSNDLQLSAEDKLILAGASFDLSTSSGAVDIISAGRIDLSGRGTLTLDTSQNNSHIVLTPGTGNIGIGSTAPVYKLDVNGTLRTSSTARIEGALTVTTGGASITGNSSVTGDLTLDGDLDFTGSQNITTTSDDLTISPTGNLIIDTSGGTVYVRDSWEVSQTSQFSGDLTLAGNANQITANNDLILTAANSMTLGTSTNNTNINIWAGSGSLNLSAGTARLTGNLIVTGTETFNGVTYTFPGADGSASNVLTTSGTGLLSWGTLGALSITADSLDFTEFKDEMTLDADTSINGDQSLVLRIGRGALQDSTGGNNDLQLAAEDKLILGAASFDLLTSSGGIDMISGSYMDLSSKGTLTLDTSANNSNILMKTGSGNINVSTGTLTMTGLLDIRDSTGTLALATDANGNVGVGTNAPTGILDILGQCVARGTMIKRRKKRRGRKHAGKTGLLPENAGWEFEDVPIEEIKEGDEILTLDEHTGHFVVQNVKKLMDKGIQAVFELVTESGKRVEATKEHPYLTIEANKKALVSQSSFDSNSPHGEHRTYQGKVYQTCQKLSSLRFASSKILLKSIRCLTKESS